MNQAFNPIFELNECTKVGNVGNRTGDMVVDHQFCTDILPGIFVELFDTERKALIGGVEVKDDSLNGFTFFIDLARVFKAFTPGDIGDMNEAVDIIFDADKETEIGNILDFSLNLGADRVFVDKAVPGIRLDLFHAERDTAFFRINA